MVGSRSGLVTPDVANQQQLAKFIYIRKMKGNWDPSKGVK